MRQKTIDPQSLGKVAVLMGGCSSERDVSLMSGSGVLKALQEKGVNAEAFDPANQPLSALENGGYDRAFIALHGRFGEDGAIQGVLNYLNLPYTGPGVQASAVAMDKDVTKILWQAAGISVPRGECITPSATDEKLKQLIDTYGATGLVIKPAHEGSSIGVTKLNPVTLETLRGALESAAQRDTVLLVEEYLHGREFTVAILDGSALPAIEIRAPQGEYDFQNKYFGDAVQYVCPAPLEEARAIALQKECERAFNVLSCRGWGRIDVMERDDGSFALLEINTSPGMTPHSLVPMAAKAVGMDYGNLCMTLLSLAQTDR